MLHAPPGLSAPEAGGLRLADLDEDRNLALGPVSTFFRKPAVGVGGYIAAGAAWSLTSYSNEYVATFKVCNTSWLAGFLLASWDPGKAPDRWLTEKG